MGGTDQERSGRSILYCVVPRDLVKLHDTLRRHYARDPAVEVVVERRSADRRGEGERRSAESRRASAERRRIRAHSGRRIADRRVPSASVEAPPLPRRARPYAARIVFVERVLPSTQHAEDVDTARLVTRFQAGDPEIFGELYVRYFDRVYAYLVVALGNPHEAEDATQQVFMKLLEALPRYEFTGTPFRAWMFVIVRNLALKLHAKDSRVDPVDPAEIARQLEDRAASDTDLEALTWISDRELLMFVDRLPLAQRQVLVLRYMMGLESRQIAAILDRSPADVRMLQARALRFLKERLTRVGHASSRQVPPARMRGCVTPALVLRSRRFALQR